MNNSSSTNDSSLFPLAVHFDHPDQQKESARLGMWVFLCTEVLFFGALICCFFILFYQYPQAFMQGSRHLHLSAGLFNTFILLLSSWCVVQADFLIGNKQNKKNKQKEISQILLLTSLLGLIFLAVKIYEYYHHYVDFLIPGLRYAPRAEWKLAAETEIFFYLYFVMTLLHALHMVIGIFFILLLSWQTKRGIINQVYHTPLEVTGLYWHFVDIVWVFIFPLLYLLGVHL